MEWLRTRLITCKLNSGLGLLVGVVVAAFCALLYGILPLKLAFVATAAIVGVPLLLMAIVDLTFGLQMTVAAGFLIGLAAKYTTAPVGTLLDLLMVWLIFGLLARLVKEKEMRYAENPVSLFILLWIGYNLLQAINPVAGSRMAWVYTVRSVALLLLLYFVALRAFESRREAFRALKTIIFWSFVAALYGLKQEFVGFTPTELAWLHADELRFQLIYQWSRLRIFSFFSDPTTYGILMACMSVTCFILVGGPWALWKRIMLAVAGISMWMAIAYAGSRTPVVMVPAGIAFATLLSLNRRTLLISGFVFLAGAAFMMKSTHSAVIYRIQSAFRPTQDASLQLRLENQEKIQPFIQSHPFGAGLGSTGYWGKRFTPDSWLANFAHDSLYVRLAVETGWIGLLLYMALLFVAMQQGIYWYYRVRDPALRLMYLALVTPVFMLALASYPQEAITLLPNSLIFYLMLAMIVRLKDFDREVSGKSEEGIAPHQ